MLGKKAIPFSPPDITDAEIDSVVETLRSGWITTGPRTKKFEKELEVFLGADRVCCLNSQTACAEMALRLLGIGPGDEVIVPAYTYTATASVVCHVGATLRLIDSGRGSLEMDYDAVYEAISERTKAIIPVDLGGVPCDYDRIFEIVEAKREIFKASNEMQEAIGRVAICADCAHSLGAVWKGKKVGSIADFSSFSFHAVKNLTTGEGGCLAWKTIPGINSEDIYKKVQLLSLHGQSKDALAKNEPGAWEYDVVGTWFKCNMTDIQASLGLSQLARYDRMLDRRREIIEKYDSVLVPLGVESLPHFTNDYASSGHLYISRIPGFDCNERNEFIVDLAREGVSSNVHYKPLPLHTAYKNMGFCIEDYPSAFDHFKCEVTLPLYSRLSDEEVEYILAIYVKALESRGYL